MRRLTVKFQKTATAVSVVPCQLHSSSLRHCHDLDVHTASGSSPVSPGQTLTASLLTAPNLPLQNMSLFLPVAAGAALASSRQWCHRAGCRRTTRYPLIAEPVEVPYVLLLATAAEATPPLSPTPPYPTVRSGSLSVGTPRRPVHAAPTRTRVAQVIEIASAKPSFGAGVSYRGGKRNRYQAQVSY